MKSAAYSVTGLGEAMPLVVAAGNGRTFAAAAAIARDEHRQMVTEISAFSIPAPRRPLAERPPGSIRVSAASEPRRPATVFMPVQQTAPVERSGGWLHRLPVIGKRLASLWQKAAQSAALEVLALSGEGDILICGEPALAHALAGAFASNGRASKVLGPTAPPSSGCASGSVLGRPAGSSLIDRLKRRRGDIAGLGCIVLAGADDFVVELGAIGDCPSPPLVVLVRPSDVGLIVTAAELPRAEGALPKISVVSVSYNQAQYLEASIRSILDQGYPNLDYVIIDGGSTDGSIEIIERYREHFSHVVIEPDDGQSNALNKGFRLATGDIMNWLCSDDLLMPGALQAVADTWRLHHADLVVGGCLRIRDSIDDLIHEHHAAIPLGATMELDAYDILKFMGSWQKGHYFFQPEVFFSRRIWDAAGSYLKEHLFYAMDYDMWLRMGLAGASVRVIPPALGCSRVHEAQKTKDDRVYLHQLARMMDEYAEMFAALEKAAGPLPAA
jgi:GT2 family glycosyltransferase